MTTSVKAVRAKAWLDGYKARDKEIKDFKISQTQAWLEGYEARGKEIRTPVSAEAMEQKIRELVCQTFNVTWEEMTQKCRKMEIVLPRMVYCFFMRRRTKVSQGSLAESVGYKDHTSVFHAEQTIQDQFESDSDFRETIKFMLTQIDNNGTN